MRGARVALIGARRRALLSASYQATPEVRPTGGYTAPSSDPILEQYNFALSRAAGFRVASHASVRVKGTVYLGQYTSRRVAITLPTGF